jgi:hypothetical protein
MISTSDNNWPNYLAVAASVKQQLKDRCNVKIEAESHFPTCCLAQDNSQFDPTNSNNTGGPTPTQQAATDMADFQRRGITTILWPGGINGDYGKAAQSQGYSPEWLVLGDGIMDANNPERLAQNTTVFNHHALTITPQTFEPALQQQRCYQALREVDGEMPESDVGYNCEYYRNLFQIFSGIQVAGPRLTPSSIDPGFRAIPKIASSDPHLPACYYEPDDYTCVKDAQVEWWDSSGQSSASTPGCYRMVEEGKRYRAGTWPNGNVADLKRPGVDQCNNYLGDLHI